MNTDNGNIVKGNGNALATALLWVSAFALAALVIAGALVAGLLAANVFVPPRRSA